MEQKTYIDILADIYKDYYRDVKTEGNRLSELVDKILVWIISLSTGSIALILAYYEKLKTLPQYVLNFTILFMVVSILTGLLGRVLMAISTYLGFQLASSFELELHLLKFPNRPRILKGDETAEDIYNMLKEDFGKDEPNILLQKQGKQGKDLLEYYAATRNHYIHYSEWSAAAYKEAATQVGNLLTRSFGYKEDYFKNKRRSNNRIKGTLMRALMTVGHVLYLFSLVTFAVAIVYISYNYILSK